MMTGLATGTRIPCWLGVALACLLAWTPLAGAQELVPGELIVHWRPRGGRRALLRVAGREVRAGRSIAEHASVYQLEEKSLRATWDAIRELERSPDVELVEPNLVRRTYRVPQDPLYDRQWHLRAVNAPAAWDVTVGDPHTVVAVVDTGILPSHPDLQGRLLAGWDFVSDSNAENDPQPGWDSDPTDTGTENSDSSSFHGTHVAGVIGAATNNSKGVAGMDWSCKILPVRAMGIKHEGTDADISAAIRWAAGLEVASVPKNPYPARIINLSFGGPGYSAALSQAISAAERAGAIVVAAAGNEGNVATNIYPASCAGVITVGATGLDGKRTAYSNYGRTVEIMAPGGDPNGTVPCSDGTSQTTCPAGIYSTLYSTATKQYGYAALEGTSQAAPVVSGVLSLMFAVRPKLEPWEALWILSTTANPTSQCDDGCGAGLIDAKAAVDMAVSPPVPNVLGGCSTGRSGAPLSAALVWIVWLVLGGSRRRVSAGESAE